MAEHETILSMAGLTLRILDDADKPAPWLVSRCKPFFAPPGSTPSPALTITIHRDAQLSSGSDRLSVKPGSQPGGFLMQGIDFVAVRRRCGLPFEVEALPEAGIAGILRWILGMALLEQGGLLLHAASCAIEGSGIAFPGPSGAGKTTISRLLQPQASLFTDETTALRFESSQPLIYSTPFAGELGAVTGPAAAPLEVLAFLQHAQQMELKPIRRCEAASWLLGCLFLPVVNEPWISQVLELVDRITESVRCVAFGFVPTDEVLEVCRERILASCSAA